MVDRPLTEERVLVFTYGTLMRGQTSAHLLRGAAFVGAASTERGYALHDMGWYPAMRPGGNGTVIGELYEIASSELATLDQYESCPGLYERRLIQLVDGTRPHSYILRLENLGNAPMIASGDWRKHSCTEP